ncbi:hypothetical protein D9M70_570320 [compost metagenome]
MTFPAISVTASAPCLVSLAASAELSLTSWVFDEMPFIVTLISSVAAASELVRAIMSLLAREALLTCSLMVPTTPFKSSLVRCTLLTTSNHLLAI